MIWKPHYVGIFAQDSCKLYCRAEQTGGYYLLKDKVIDGTNCLENNKCINGLCVEAGCDNVIYSKRELDSCGVCAGDNSTCSLVEGAFNQRKVKYGYNFVVKIPANAINIVIRQLNGTIDDDNSLALRTSNGSYLINGDAVISTYERVVWYEGVKIEYTGTGVSKESEVIESTNDSSVEDEMLRISNDEQRLRAEYNSQLDRLKHNKVAYSMDYMNRLHAHRYKIKEYRQQLQNLVKGKSMKSSGNQGKKPTKEPKQFVEMLVIKQTLKKPLIVEVLSVGRLVKPDIRYRYSISKQAVYKSQFDKQSIKQDKNHLKKAVGAIKQHSTYWNYQIKNDRSGESKKELDHLRIDKLNLKSNDKAILNKLKIYAHTGQKKRYDKTDPDSKPVDKPNDLNQTLTNNEEYFLNQRYEISVGKNLHVKKGTKQVKIRCPSYRSVVNTKWYKNGIEMQFLNRPIKSMNESIEQALSDFGEQNDASDQANPNDNRKENYKRPLSHTLNRSTTDQTIKTFKQSSRFHLDKLGALIIRNIKKMDRGVYTCPLHTGHHSQLVVI